MAKRRRKYRGLGDIVALPFSNLVDDIQGSMKGTDVLVGALVGVAGIGAFNWLKAQTWAPAFLKTNTTVARFTPALVGVAAAAGAYFGDKKLLKMPSRAAGHAAGALGVGLALQAIQEAKAKFPLYFSDIVDLRLNGLLIDDVYRRRALNGMIIDDPIPASAAAFNGYADNPSLAGLAALDMGLLEDDDMADLGLN